MEYTVDNELASGLSQWEGEIGLIDLACPRWERREWWPIAPYMVCICILWPLVSRLWVTGFTAVEWGERHGDSGRYDLQWSALV